jgi:hypothetical protein
MWYMGFTTERLIKGTKPVMMIMQNKIPSRPRIFEIAHHNTLINPLESLVDTDSEP